MRGPDRSGPVAADHRHQNLDSAISRLRDVKFMTDPDHDLQYVLAPAML
jgi:hypothetical protein